MTCNFEKLGSKFSYEGQLFRALVDARGDVSSLEQITDAKVKKVLRTARYFYFVSAWWRYVKTKLRLKEKELQTQAVKFAKKLIREEARINPSSPPTAFQAPSPQLRDLP